VSVDGHVQGNARSWHGGCQQTQVKRFTSTAID